MVRIWSSFIVIVILFSLMGAAFAQDEDVDLMNMQLFRPSIFGGNFIAIDDATTLQQLGFGFALYYDYANSLFSYYKDGDSESAYDIISELHTGHVSAAFGIMDWWSIGAYLPVHYMRYREFVDGFPILVVNDKNESSDLLWGDAMAKMKFRALRQDLHWIGMAVVPYVTFPTGDDTYLIGEGRTTAGGTLVLEHDFGFFDIGLNGGYLWRQDANELVGTKVGDAVTFGAGISKTFDMGLGLGLEYWGRYYAIEDPDQLSNFSAELTGTIRYQFGKAGPRLVAGGGPGLADGVGTPSYRLLAGIDYYYRRPEIGTLEVKTVDENQKQVSATLEITDSEGMKKVSSSDGNLGVKYPPGTYQVVATREGYESAGATAYVEGGKRAELLLTLKEIPPPKTVLGMVITDKCSGEKITADLEFPDGKKVIAAGGEYSAQMSAGEYEIVLVADGYEKKKIVVMVEKEKTTEIKVGLFRKIKKTGKVYFATGSNSIMTKSYPVLNNVADQIKQICNFEQVTIEGHTDSRGDDDKNMGLSRRRGESVKAYLVSAGIDPAKLKVVPHGETEPVASNETVFGREENRRVEFVIQ